MTGRTLNAIGMVCCLGMLTIGNEPGWLPLMWLALGVLNLWALAKED